MPGKAAKITITECQQEILRTFETIARLPGGLSEQIAIEGRNSW